MNKTIIAWDLGATNCTAGLIQANEQTGELICQRTYAVKLQETESLADLVTRLENGLQHKMANAHAICIGGAGKFDGRTLLHTNPYPYPMQFSEVAEQQHWPVYTV